MVRDVTDRSEAQVDYRFMQLLLTGDDPEVSMGEFAGVERGARLLRLPALYRAKKNDGFPNNLTLWTVGKKP